MLFFDLDFKTEAELFDTINSTQRKVPKPLIEVTKGNITETESTDHAQEVRKIAFTLARDKDSVWFGQINMTGARDPERRVIPGRHQPIAGYFDGVRPRPRRTRIGNRFLIRFSGVFRVEGNVAQPRDDWQKGP